MIGNRTEEQRVCTFYYTLLEKAGHTVRINWQQFQTEKCLSLSRDLNQAFSDRMPSLYHLCHQHFLFLSKMVLLTLESLRMMSSSLRSAEADPKNVASLKRSTKTHYCMNSLNEHGSICCTAEEDTLRDQEVVGSNPARSWALILLSFFSVVRPLTGSSQWCNTAYCRYKWMLRGEVRSKPSLSKNGFFSRKPFKAFQQNFSF